MFPFYMAVVLMTRKSISGRVCYFSQQRNHAPHEGFTMNWWSLTPIWKCQYVYPYAHIIWDWRESKGMDMNLWHPLQLHSAIYQFRCTWCRNSISGAIMLNSIKISRGQFYTWIDLSITSLNKIWKFLYQTNLTLADPWTACFNSLSSILVSPCTREIKTWFLHKEM